MFVCVAGENLLVLMIDDLFSFHRAERTWSFIRRVPFILSTFYSYLDSYFETDISHLLQNAAYSQRIQQLKQLFGIIS